ncbi:alpha-glucosidase maltase [Cryptotrichosporon argae]
MSDWWRQAVVYQIYPRSFADANGDGIGDLKGITSRVPYLKQLNVDAVWLSPFYPSALKDGGYDVADYRDVDPKIGTLADFDEMIAALKAANIRVIVDIVPNHCSDDHEWFRAALKAGRGSPERERFIFRDSDNGPPTDWVSVFGGPSWTQVEDGQWYYHMFDTSQPDFDWSHPDVRADFLKTLRFWGERGVSGFRIDVAHGLVKDMSDPLPNWETLTDMTNRKLRNGQAKLVHPILDRDEVHDVYREWRQVFNEFDPPLTAVAECWVAPDRKPLYASADGLGQAFSFDILVCNFDADEYKKCIDESLRDSAAAGSSTTWVLSNHDVVRHATRFGMPKLELQNLHQFQRQCNDWLVSKFEGIDEVNGLKKARAATLMLLGLPGSTYLYQGEELGLAEVADIPPSERQDPTFFRTNGAEVGRDGCRVPLPWAEGDNFGFGGMAHLPQPEWFGKFAVSKEDREADSTLNLYRKALALRRELQTAEELAWVESASGVLHYRRPNGWEVVLNMTDKPVSLPKGKVLLVSEAGVHDAVPAFGAVWLQA